MKLHRKFWMQLHLYLSLFFLPAALIYAITGALFIFEIRANSGATIEKIPLDSKPARGEERDFIINILQEHNLKVPDNTEIKMGKGGSPSMGNIKYSASIVNDQKDGLVLQVIDRSLYGILVLMHFSKGDRFELGGFKFMWFDFIAITFGLSMILFYLSGLIMTSFCKGKRKAGFGVMILGFIVTIIATYFSI
ncbi:hypothetical protein [Helicobacter marmotae]|uniref:Uncharacterized protein n=1 Tax=Helicobacter marmotae TaxID=152490 RepID=A0A3D8I521_9HELI|nr:hypothetical protein [Helicobacter marmotae]RDU60239.1 hypothetical protein CQA63_03220 [Helicobacter marmotae]